MSVESNNKSLYLVPLKFFVFIFCPSRCGSVGRSIISDLKILNLAPSQVTSLGCRFSRW